MTPRKRPITTGRTSAAKKPRRRTGVKRSQGNDEFAGFLVPLFFIAGILLCLGFLSLMGYRTATASAFFDVKSIEMRGVVRASEDDIKRIIKAETQKSGVWNADLAEIKTDVEKLMFVRSAVVSRVLPDGLLVIVNERVPRVVLQMKAGDFWTDEDSTMLGPVAEKESRPPFALRGWDESKSEKANRENQERVKIYLKMLNEWQTFDLAKRVSAVNLANLQDPQIVVPDSGYEMTISLGREDFGRRLRGALESLTGKGNTVESAISNGQNVVITKYREK